MAKRKTRRKTPLKRESEKAEKVFGLGTGTSILILSTLLMLAFLVG